VALLMTVPNLNFAIGIPGVVLSVLCAAVLASLAAGAACNESTHHRVKEVCRNAPFLLTHGSPIEHPAPWNAARSSRPDHPPPVVRGGWVGAGAWGYALSTAPRIALSHVVCTLLVVSIYARYGRPGRIGGLGGQDDKDLSFWSVWRQVLAVGAWTSVAWCGVALLAWVLWYWVLVAQLPAVASPVYLDPPGVVGILLGGVVGYLFTIAAVTRGVVRRRSNRTPAHCLRCWYSLAGVPRGICPECGREAQPSDAHVFALTRPLMRVSISKCRLWRWLLVVGRAALVLYLLAFPRLVLVTGWCLTNEYVFERVALAAHPWAYRVTYYAGLGGSGEHDVDVIGLEGHPEPPIPKNLTDGW